MKMCSNLNISYILKLSCTHRPSLLKHSTYYLSTTYQLFTTSLLPDYYLLTVYYLPTTCLLPPYYLSITY